MPECSGFTPWYVSPVFVVQSPQSYGRNCLYLEAWKGRLDRGGTLPGCSLGFAWKSRLESWPVEFLHNFFLKTISVGVYRNNNEKWKPKSHKDIPHARLLLIKRWWSIFTCFLKIHLMINWANNIFIIFFFFKYSWRNKRITNVMFVIKQLELNLRKTSSISYT